MIKRLQKSPLPCGGLCSSKATDSIFLLSSLLVSFHVVHFYYRFIVKIIAFVNIQTF